MKKTLDEREQCDLECLSVGAFHPLTTYMTKTQYESCMSLKHTKTKVFPIPIMCSVEENVPIDTQIELRSQTGILKGVLTVKECWPIDVKRECRTVFKTLHPNHPYIKYLRTKTDKWYVSGSIQYITTNTPCSEYWSSTQLPLISTHIPYMTYHMMM